MSRFAKALAVTTVGATAILAILAYATLSARIPLSANELSRISYGTLEDLVEEAIAVGGLENASALFEERLESRLGSPVEVIRPPRPASSPPFGFRVTADGITTWVSPEGLTDPLAAIRRGERRLVRADTVTILPGHSDHEALARCVDAQEYHASLTAPDLFARLENRTVSDGHGGFEALVIHAGEIALDRFVLAGLPTPPEALRPYGL